MVNVLRRMSARLRRSTDALSETTELLRLAPEVLVRLAAIDRWMRASDGDVGLRVRWLNGWFVTIESPAGGFLEMHGDALDVLSRLARQAREEMGES